MTFGTWRSTKSAQRSVVAHVTRPQAKRLAGKRKEQAPVQPEEESATQKIYIGQGRYVEDDPAKYPDRDGLGVGGWAGGEEGTSASAIALTARL
jgi:hypothetical protein